MHVPVLSVVFSRDLPRVPHAGRLRRGWRAAPGPRYARAPSRSIAVAVVAVVAGCRVGARSVVAVRVAAVQPRAGSAAGAGGGVM